MNDSQAARSRLTRFPELKTRPKPAPRVGGARDAAPPAVGGMLAEPRPPYGVEDAGTTAGPPPPRAPDPAPLRAAAEAARRRRAWRLRVARVLPVLCWLIVAGVPLATLFAEVSLTSRCTLPAGAAEGRMRLLWHQFWLGSTIATLLPVAYLVWRAPGKLAAGAVLGAFALWKGLALARDRIALPACVTGWADGTPRDPAEMQLTLAVAGAFALFAFLAGLAALLRSARLAQAA